MVLPKQRITKALISLRGCAGWSVPLLFTNPQRQVSLRRGPLIIVFLRSQDKNYCGLAL